MFCWYRHLGIRTGPGESKTWNKKNEISRHVIRVYNSKSQGLRDPLMLLTLNTCEKLVIYWGVFTRVIKNPALERTHRRANILSRFDASCTATESTNLIVTKCVYAFTLATPGTSVLILFLMNSMGKYKKHTMWGRKQRETRIEGKRGWGYSKWRRFGWRDGLMDQIWICYAFHYKGRYGRRKT